MAVILLPSDSTLTLLLMLAICLNVFSVIASALLRQQTLLKGCFCMAGESRHANMLLQLLGAAVRRGKPAGKKRPVPTAQDNELACQMFRHPDKYVTHPALTGTGNHVGCFSDEKYIY